MTKSQKKKQQHSNKSLKAYPLTLNKRVVFEYITQVFSLCFLEGGMW